MKTLVRLVIPATLAALLAAPAAWADHDRDGYGFRYDNDRYHDIRNDARREHDGFYSRDTRRHLAEYERDRRKRLAEAARHNRKHHAAHERAHDKRLRDARHDHRHVVNCRHWSHYSRTGADRHFHDDDFWSVVLDVAFVY